MVVAVVMEIVRPELMAVQVEEVLLLQHIEREL
jgi:hypothetical protein